MNEPTLFLIASISDNALIGTWTFRADDELAVARYLLQHLWEYDDVFRALRLTPKQREQLSPDDLLVAIRDSDRYAHLRGVVYLLRLPAPAVCQVTEPPR